MTNNQAGKIPGRPPGSRTVKHQRNRSVTMTCTDQVRAWVHREADRINVTPSTFLLMLCDDYRERNRRHGRRELRKPDKR